MFTNRKDKNPTEAQAFPGGDAGATPTQPPLEGEGTAAEVGKPA